MEPPPGAFSTQAIAGKVNMPGKKSNGVAVPNESTESKPKRKRQVAKGGFSVYRVVDMKGVSVNDERGTVGFEGDEALVLAKAKDGTFAQGLADTTDAVKWIREHAGEFDGVVLLIVQEKRRVTPKIEKVEKVVIE